MSLVLLVTTRVRQDIAAFAAGADLTLGEAEAIALDQLSHDCARRVGGNVTTTLAHPSSDHHDLRRYVGPDTTAIAIPARLATRRTVRRLTAATGLPVVVAPEPRR